MLGWLQIFARSRREFNLLHDSEHFQAMLKRERSRADRAGSVFSVLVLDLPRRHHCDRVFRVISAVFAERLRATDSTGFLPDDRIAVVLPDTTADGAQELLHNLREALAANDIHFDDDLFVYPDDDLRDFARNNQEQAGKREEQVTAILCECLPTWKRLLDVAGAGSGLILLSPLLAITALAIKFTSRGPIFFRQQRAGLGDRPFVLYKFRTMCANAEEKKTALMAQNEQDGPAFKIKHDPRVTPLGRILRKSCIDELPQLINVLKGEMTLVGPRPLPCHESDLVDGWQRRRLDVTPGLTCTWQASARRVSFAEWARMDIRYAQRRSLPADLALVWKTFVKVVQFRAST